MILECVLEEEVKWRREERRWRREERRRSTGEKRGGGEVEEIKRKWRSTGEKRRVGGNIVVAE